MSVTLAAPVKERPIIMGADSVRAILRGDKTQTRRVLHPQPETVTSQRGETLIRWHGKGHRHCQLGAEHFALELAKMSAEDYWGRPYCPYGKAGDRLWVRESFAARTDIDPATDIERARHYLVYRADGSGFDPADENNWHDWGGKWRSPLFMPRALSRLTLEITEIRVERLQAITEVDALAEGIVSEPDHLGPHFGPQSGEMTNRTAYAAYARVWNDINASRGHAWDTNPFVWVVSFRRVAA